MAKYLFAIFHKALIKLYTLGIYANKAILHLKNNSFISDLHPFASVIANVAVALCVYAVYVGVLVVIFFELDRSLKDYVVFVVIFIVCKTDHIVVVFAIFGGG